MGKESSPLSGAEIQKLRVRVTETWSEQVPEDTPEGWSRSPVDLTAVLVLFPKLRLKAGFILRAYQYRESGNGEGIVWSMPEELPFPEVGDVDPEETPRPTGAIDVMEAIEGDGSLESYLQASILQRELSEFGAFGHGLDWGNYYVLGDGVWANPPLQSVSPGQETPSGTPDTWQWLAPQPADYQPCIEQKEGAVHITFYVYSALGQERIIRNEDIFEIGKYSFKTDSQTIAVGTRGYVV